MPDQPLLQPFDLGALRLPNRVVMAPLTRARATNPGLLPTELHAAYYAQRATAGLIVSEGVWVSERAVAFPHVPGLFTEEQTVAWRRVTGLVRALGGRIVAQLWHAGSASPGEMTGAEIAGFVKEYATAAARARRAGFDGVEIAANGVYPLARFLNARLNSRTDAYGPDGGRPLLDVVDAVCGAWDDGTRRVGVRLSPYWSRHDDPRAGEAYPWMPDEAALSRYDEVVTALSGRPLAYLHLRGPAPLSGPDEAAFARYRRLYDGPLIANHGFGRESGNALVRAGTADAVSYARHFIANPDLVTRLALGHDLAAGDPALHYEGGARGYVDHPAWTPAPLPLAG
ncbi:alkene reductase [Streptomyces sp. NPDC048172]|uniref:oxidoreductase n=1 Tax=Streptomyces sp. NPDC048172 TaxID=3365505 RepID=UPI003713ACB7